MKNPALVLPSNLASTRTANQPISESLSSILSGINLHHSAQFTAVRDNRMKTKGGRVEGMAALSQLDLGSGNLGPLRLRYDLKSIHVC